MSTLKETYLVTKRNILNEIRSNNLTLQELRFFSIYLAKINPADIGTRVVRFHISDFQAIMELGSQIKVGYLKRVTDSLLCKVVTIPEGEYEYTSFQLFKKCKVGIDDDGERYVEIDAHDDALPMMFEFKERYFSYQLWNALSLKSSNQVRMYEILKQFEKIGSRIWTVNDLKELLGIRKEEYLRYDNFKIWVLDVCQKALEEYTDIRFDYEPWGKKGKGGKILQIKFTISKNTNYKNPITLEKFIDLQPDPDNMILDDGVIVENKIELDPEHVDLINRLMGAFNNEFSFEEVDYLNELIANRYPDEKHAYDYFCAKYKYLETQKRKIKSTRYGYLRAVIEKEIEKEKSDVAERQAKNRKTSAYIEELTPEQEMERMERLLERQQQQAKEREINTEPIN